MGIYKMDVKKTGIRKISYKKEQLESHYREEQIRHTALVIQ